MKRCGNYLLYAALLITGCLPKKAPPSGSFSEPAYSQQYRQHALLAIVSLSETNLPTSGKIKLLIDVHAPSGAAVVFPELETLIAPFSIAESYPEPIQNLPNGKQLHRRGWTLLPALPGPVEFLPFQIYAGNLHIETAPIPLRVTSRLPSSLNTLEIKDISPPIELLPQEAHRKHVWKWSIGTAAAALLIGLLVRRIRQPKEIIPRTPDEKALLALANLPHRPAEKIDALNQILLTFIEEQFHVPLSGKVLQETCALLPKHELLGRRHQLEKFLVAADQARFSNIISDKLVRELECYTHKFIQESLEVEA